MAVTTTGNSVIDDSCDFSQQFETNGLTLVLDKTSTAYARRKKLKNVRVFIVIEKGEVVERVIYNGSQAVYSSQQLESIACHIDILSLLEK